jgi:hypothetical protein
MIALLPELGDAIRVFSGRTGDVEPLAEGGSLSPNIVAVPIG